jgi:hypothetical protein
MIRFQRMPAVWDHEYWGLMLNMAFLVCYGTAGSSILTAETWFIPLVRQQLAILYAAATFWKLTTSFLNPITSCGTVVIMEFLTSYLPLSWSTLDPNSTSILIQLAPHATLFIEGVLAVGFAYIGWYGSDGSSRWIRDATLLSGVVFHLMIAMMPTNYAAGFSLECMTRFILVLDDTTEWQRIVQYTRQSYTRIIWLGIMFLLIPAGLCGWRWDAIGMPVDIGFVCTGLLTVFYGWLVLASRWSNNSTSAGTTTTSKAATAASTTTMHSYSSSSWKRRLVLGSVLFLTTLYAFGTPILGIMQQSAPTMYSNLRYYRGGNHLLVPMSILGEDILFGGGLVQVVTSTSWSLNIQIGHLPSRAVFPPRMNDVLEPKLRSPDSPYAGLPFQMFPMCLFNPSSRAIMLDEYLVYHPTHNTTLLTPVIFPVSTIRTALQRSQDNQEEYVVELSESLDPNPSAVVRLTSDGSCYHVVSGTIVGSCFQTNLPYNQNIIQWFVHHVGKDTNSPSSWAIWFWQPIVHKLLAVYPELVGFEEEICMT